MSTIQGYKGRVLVVPFEREGTKAVVKSAFAAVAHRSTLVGLEVVYGNGIDIHPGDTVFVKPDGQKSWGADVVTVDDKWIVVCPPEFVIAVKRAPYQKPEATPRPDPPHLPSPDKTLFPIVVK
jgi:hypothetical protein